MQIEITLEYLHSQGLSKTFPQRFWKKVQKTDGCWLWTGYRDAEGRGQISTSGYNTPIRAHIASWILHKGPVPDGLCVCHTCDNPPCVNPDHLWIGTKADNSADMVSKGRAQGRKRKLTWESVNEIRQSDFPRHTLALMFGVSQTMISLVRHYRVWKVRPRPYS